MAIQIAGSALKCRVGRVGGNTGIFLGFIKFNATLVCKPPLLCNGYIKVGGVIQHGMALSFEYRFRSVKQYHRKESF